MFRISCKRNDAHQTLPVQEQIRTGRQKGPDGKYHVNPNLPKKIRAIAHPPTDLFLLTAFFTVVAAGLSLWRLFAPEVWVKLPLSAFSELIGTYGPWAAVGGAAASFLLWRFWRPGYLEALRVREEGIYCYECDEIFFQKGTSRSNYLRARCRM